MRISTALLLMLFSAAAAAEVMVVNIFDPMPGKAGQTMQNAEEARSILKEVGTEPVVATDQMGNLHFGTTFKDWASWAEFQSKLQSNEKWTNFTSKLQQNPSATQIESYMMERPVVGGLGNVIQVFIWKPEPGKSGKVLENAQGAKPIHEKLGADIGVNVDQLGHVHYVMGFESWEAWGKFQQQLEQSEEWSSFWNSLQQEPAAELAKVYMVTTQ